MTFKRLMLATAATVFLATGVAAQDRTGTTPQTGTPSATDGAATSQTTTTAVQTKTMTFVSRVNADQMMASDFMGMKVRNNAGEEIGDINDLVVDNQGNVGVVVIGVGGFLGIGEKYVGVPYEAVSFAMQNSEPVVSVEATKATLETAPNFVFADEKKAAVKVKTN